MHTIQGKKERKVNALDLMRTLDSESTASCKVLPDLPEVVFPAKANPIKSDLPEHSRRDTTHSRKPSTPLGSKRRTQSVSTVVSGSKPLLKNYSTSHIHGRSSSTSSNSSSSSSSKPRSPSSRSIVAAGPHNKRPTSGSTHKRPSKT